MIVNTFRPRQNGRHFADDIFKCIFLDENVWIPIEISLKFVPKGSINNNPSLFQIMAWRRPGDKLLSEPMIVSLLTHIWRGGYPGCFFHYESNHCCSNDKTVNRIIIPRQRWKRYFECNISCKWCWGYSWLNLAIWASLIYLYYYSRDLAAKILTEKHDYCSWWYAHVFEGDRIGE